MEKLLGICAELVWGKSWCGFRAVGGGSGSAQMRRDLTEMETLSCFSFSLYYSFLIKLTPSCLWWCYGLKYKHVVVSGSYCFSFPSHIKDF